MISVNDVKKIIVAWAKTLPFKVKVHLFGSFLKGDKIPSDIDISLEFLESFSEVERTLLWIKHHKNWETYLSERFGMKADLQLYEADKNIPKYLASSSLLLFDSQVLEAEYGINTCQ
jgi:predicted nucleotidyltransferase